MTVMALEVGRAEFAASRIGAESGSWDIRRVPVPVDDAWTTCRDLLLDVAGDEEVTAVVIACPGPVHRPSGIIAPDGIPQWRNGFGIAEAVRRLFPVAIVRVATDGLCLTLAERGGGSGWGDAILAGAGTLALLIDERRDDRSAPDRRGGPGARYLREPARHWPTGRAVCRRQAR
ncbi:ROK family protein [Nocardia mexicana]|uniref:ROK family protein n=1 Tax=Nocardia mexicana TaxID=279262 RepID=A0A370HDE1_9NOCA|nr:ROK family protein [Nocardia mexicana]RDI54511.1 hypothetical protein DFR68_102639 [Nocardia mexicana]